MRLKWKVFIRLGVGLGTGVLPILALLTCGFVEWSGASESIGPRVEVGETNINLGSVANTSSVVHTLTIGNSGDTALSIEVSKANCGCVLGEFDNSDIKPGQQVDMAITVSNDNPHARITLTTNDPERPVIVVSIEAVFESSVVAVPIRLKFQDCDALSSYTQMFRVSCFLNSQSRVPKVLEVSAEGSEVISVDLLKKNRTDTEAHYDYKVSVKPHRGAHTVLRVIRIVTDALDKPELLVSVDLKYRYRLDAEPRLAIIRAGKYNGMEKQIHLHGEVSPRTPTVAHSMDDGLVARLEFDEKTQEYSAYIAIKNSESNKGFRSKILILDQEGYTLSEVPVLVMSTYGK